MTIITRETLVTNLREADMPVYADIAHSLILDLEASQTANEKLQSDVTFLIGELDFAKQQVKKLSDRWKEKGI